MTACVRICYLLFLLIACLCGVASATVIDVPGDQPTIQAAIDAASTGDEVVLAVGTYVENIDFKGKAITVRSTNPNNPAVVAATRIDGNDDNTTVKFVTGETASSVLTGLTIRNGNDVGSAWGGGIRCVGSSPTITRNAINNNTAYGAGGIYCGAGSSPTITENQITDNVADTGAGIYCEDSTGVVISGNTFSANSANRDGGALFVFNGTATVSGNTFQSNASGGVAVGCDEGSLSFVGNIVTGNTSTSSGAMSVANGSSLIQGNIISGNTGTVGPGAYGAGGGGIWASYGSVTIRGNAISGNTITGGGDGLNYGGGILCYMGTPVIESNVLLNNSAARGGGISLVNTSALVKGNTLVGNQASSNGGGIYFKGPDASTVTSSIIAFSPSGNGLVRDKGSAALTIEYCDVFGNTGSDYLNATAGTGCISADPKFVNTTPGVEDLHLQSKGGHWTPGGWVVDTVTSPCLDAAAPGLPFANELRPNGKRRNMGAFGNTYQASKALPAVAGCSPKHVGALNTVPFTAWFNVAMHRVSVENNFTITPTKAGSFSWMGTKIIFTPTTPWVVNRWYTVKIAAAARSNVGIRMGTAFSWNFKTVAPTAPAMITATASPTRAGAEISVNLLSAANVSVQVTNLAGRAVAVLPERDLPDGASVLLWGRKSSAGTRAPAGQYVVRVTARAADGAQASTMTTLRLN